MADNVLQDLLLEKFRENRALHDETHERHGRLKLEVRAMKSHMLALVQSDLNRDADWASLSERVRRIERRLELNDGNV